MTAEEAFQHWVIGTYKPDGEPVKNVFTAGYDGGREEGLREAAALCLETRIKHPYQPAQEACYLAILRLLEKKP